MHNPTKQAQAIDFCCRNVKYPSVIDKLFVTPILINFYGNEIELLVFHFIVLLAKHEDCGTAIKNRIAIHNV